MVRCSNLDQCLARIVSAYMPELIILVFSSLYYKPMTIVNDDSRVVNKLEASLTDDARVIIYDCHMFFVQATGKP
jgi:hypothetical protein